MNCKLKNYSDTEYTIEHDSEVITYSDEILSSVLKTEIFSSSEIIERDIKIDMKRKGKQTLTVTAEFDVIDPYTKKKKNYRYMKDVSSEVN